MRASALVCALACWGCGGGEAAPDAGAPDAGVAAPAAPAAPALPAWPCPSGWREVTDGELVTCDPYPAGGAATCAADEAHFPGEPGCRRIGSACPAGEWADGLPTAGQVLYVRAGGGPGGDGSSAAPFGTIAEAMAAATPPTVIALGKGSFDEEIALAAGVTLRGACVAQTELRPTAPTPMTGVVTVQGAGAAVENLTIRGDQPGVVAAIAGASVTVEDVVVSGGRIAGVWVVGASASLTDVAVRDVQASAGSVYGRGLEADYGAHVDVTRAVFERNQDDGVSVYGAGSTAVLTDVAVRDTLGAPDGTFGRGLHAEQSQVDVTRGVFAHNHDFGVMAYAATVGLTDVIVSDTQSRSIDGRFGRALGAEAGSHVEVTRAALAGNQDFGLLAIAAGTTVALTDVVVADTVSRTADDQTGVGAAILDGAALAGTRVAFVRNDAIGCFADGTTTTVGFEDLIVRDTLGETAPVGHGRALDAEEGVHVDVTRASLERNRDVAVFVADAGTAVTLTDVTIAGTRSREVTGEFGRGLEVQGGGHADVTRAVFDANRSVAIDVVDQGSSVTLTDVVARDTGGREADGLYGIAVQALRGARADVLRAVFERNRLVCLLAANAGTVLTLADVVVRDTAPQECQGQPGCSSGSLAISLGAYDEAQVEATRFLFSHSAFVGVQLSLGGTVDLHDGEVSGNPIGANVQDQTFDLARIQDRVLWTDNDINFDGSALPLPGADPPIP